MRISAIFFVLATAIAFTFADSTLSAADWSIPLAGNTYCQNPDAAGRLFHRAGALRLSDTDRVYSVYFHLDRPGKIKLAIEASLQGEATERPMQVEVSVDSKKFATELHDDSQQVYPVGEVEVTQSGYVRVDLQCTHSEEAAVAKISNLRVSSDVDGLTLNYVKNNDGNMFYWGRRGPSVHLSYQLPPDTELTYAYSEITVPGGQDSLGAYFMANGFSEGYFGFQVNSPTERRVLFSVWSPFHTDNPADIPEDQRVATLAKGDDVTAKDFGHEGSGGQSFLKYPWKSGVTYRFLTEVNPDGVGNTVYTSWFGDKQANEWRLLASFRRPKTDKHLTGFHSFLENFIPDYGHLQRSADYGNQWVRDTQGEWHEITRAKFTGDNTARGRHRLDYAGGTEDGQFFLRHCGFFSDQVALDQVFQRNSTAKKPPEIEFEVLPRG